MRTRITVHGMSCVNCVRHLTEAIQGLPGTNDVKIELPTGEVTFEKPDSLTMEDIASAIEGAGYKMLN